MGNPYQFWGSGVMLIHSAFRIIRQGKNHAFKPVKNDSPPESEGIPACCGTYTGTGKNGSPEVTGAHIGQSAFPRTPSAIFEKWEGHERTSMMTEDSSSGSFREELPNVAVW